MDRRAFLGIGGGLLSAPLAAEAQPAVKVCRVAVLTAGIPHSDAPVHTLEQRLTERVTSRAAAS